MDEVTENNARVRESVMRDALHVLKIARIPRWPDGTRMWRQLVRHSQEPHVRHCAHYDADRTRAMGLDAAHSGVCRDR